MTLPAGTRKLAWLGFSPDGRRFAFTQASATGRELWVGDTATGRSREVQVLHRMTGIDPQHVVDARGRRFELSEPARRLSCPRHVRTAHDRLGRQRQRRRRRRPDDRSQVEYPTGQD